MGCQSARRVRLSDQALVAVTIARRLGEGAGRVTVADLLAGLAAEPDGRAGHLLRERTTPAGRLAGRAGGGPPGLPALDAATARAVPVAAPRPPGTADLLLASLETGGPKLTELLAAAGYDARDLYRAAARAPTGPWTPGAETVGLGSDADLTPGAALAVARVRAAAGGAVDLILAVAALPEATRVLDASTEELAVLAGAGAGSVGARPGRDHGLDLVVDAARAWCVSPITAADLLRAARIAGGPSPAALLDAAGRLSADPRP